MSNAAAWDRFYTITNPTAGDTYTLRTIVASAAGEDGRDTNGWGLEVGYDNDTDPTTKPANFDRQGGSPIEVGISRGTVQYTLPDNDPRCMVTYQDVETSDFNTIDGVDTIAFHNFDIEGGTAAEVWYYDPNDKVYRGTWDDGRWNGPDGTDIDRGQGDVIYEPTPGQWRLVTCTRQGDQYVQEGITGKPTYFAADRSLFP
jgi:hypothetical protein